MDRRARYYGFIKDGWYQLNRKRFFERLNARYLAISHGLEPGPFHQVIQVFTNSRKKRFSPGYSSHKTILKLVEMFDQIVKEKSNDNNEHCGEKN